MADFVDQPRDFLELLGDILAWEISQIVAMVVHNVLEGAVAVASGQIEDHLDAMTLESLLVLGPGVPREEEAVLYLEEGIFAGPLTGGEQHLVLVGGPSFGEVEGLKFGSAIHSDYKLLSSPRWSTQTPPKASRNSTPKKIR